MSVPDPNRRLHQLERHISSSTGNIQAQKQSNMQNKESTSVKKASKTTTVAENVNFQEKFAGRIFELHRPKARNALSLDMIREIKRQVIEEWDSHDMCRVIIGKGAEGNWCAGGDVKALVLQLLEQGVQGKENVLQYFREEYELDFKLSRLSKPYVVLMDGIAMGGGAGLGMFTPLRVSTERTRWAMPEVKIGYFPDVGASWFLPRLGGEKSKIGLYLALTGGVVRGRDIYDLGISSHFVPSRSLDQLVDRLCRMEEVPLPSASSASSSLLSSSFSSSSAGRSTSLYPNTQVDSKSISLVGSTISEFYEHQSTDQSEWGALEFEGINEKGWKGSNNAREGGKVREALEWCFSGSSVKDILSRIKVKTQEGGVVGQWAEKTKLALEGGAASPTSLVVAFEAYRRGAESVKSIDAAFKSELPVVGAFVNGATGDFVEGIGAMMIRKEAPGWNPPSLDMIDEQAIVQRFFG